MKVFSTLINRFYIIFLFISVLMIRLASFIMEKLSENVIGYTALISAFVTTVCLLFQLLDKIPLSFVMIRGGSVNKSKYKLGASSDDIKREKIQNAKQIALYIATIAFPIMIATNILGLLLL